MGSSNQKCSFCDRKVDVTQDGWRLKDSTYAKLCDVCITAFKEDTFCQKYHKHENGWRKCDNCEKEVHCGCIMGLHTYETNDASGVTCKKCLKHEILMASQVGNSSGPDLPDCSQHNCPSSTENSAGENMVDQGSLKLLNGDLQNPDSAITGGKLDQTKLPNSDCVFLFEKKLTSTDCKFKYGRIQLPKKIAEKVFPMPVGKKSMPIVIKDTCGQTWNLMLRWWAHKNSRKYVIDGVRPCILIMTWNEGDTLNFYRQLPDGPFIMELIRAVASSSAQKGLCCDVA